MNEKTCTKCNQTFPATKEYFHSKADGRYGLCSRCKACKNQYGARYYKSNKGLILSNAKQYYKENKEVISERERRHYEQNKEAIAEYNRQYYEANKELLIESSRQYRGENKERIAEWGKQWRENNAEKVRILNSCYRARKQALPATFTSEQWDYCLEYFNYTCPTCDNQLRDLFGNVEPHADHWIPISYEGDDNPGTVATNMVCLCNNCNLSKGAKLPDEWLKDTYGTRKANEILARIEAYFDHVSDDEQAKSA